MNNEIVVTFILLISFYLILTKKRKKIISVNLDNISRNVYIPTLKKTTRFQKKNYNMTLFSNQSIEIITSQTRADISVYESINDSLLYYIENSKIAIFGMECGYIVPSKIKIMIRCKEPDKIIINKYEDYKDIKNKNKALDFTEKVVDENEYYTDLNFYVKEVKKQIESENKILRNIFYSERFFPVPHINYCSKLECSLSKDEILVIITTNKKKNGITTNHEIEIVDNVIFDPFENCDKPFSLHRIKCSEDTTYKIIEKATEISNNSIILPFIALVFTSI